MRYSRQREAIMQIVKGTTCHPSAEWVYEQARKQLPNISLGTVYRNLKSLNEDKQIITLETEIGAIHYDGNTSTHAHFICNGCGEIIDIFDRSDLRNAAEKMGLSVENEKVVFYGKCNNCIAK